MDTNPSAPSSGNILDASEDLPKKYVRTYAEDIEIAKKGGTPTLHQMEPSAPVTQSPVAVPAPAPRPAPTPPPPPIPVAPPPPPVRAPLPPPPPVPPPAPRPVAPPELVGALQTYTTDFADRVKETRASRATLIASEQDSRQGAPKQEEPEKKSSLMVRVYAGMGVLLLIAGGVGVYVAYTRYVAAHMPIFVTPPAVAAPILVEDRVKVSGTGDALMHALAESVNVPLAAGTVRLLYTIGSATTSSDAEPILTTLHTSAPGILIRNITAKGSMAGVIATKAGVESQSPFFILSVAAYNETFAGMLQWEPRMQSDLNLLFPPYTFALASSTSASSTTPITLPQPVSLGKATFVDDTVANHDVRIYRDARGHSILLYGYWNLKTLIIARDPAAFTEILQRLASAHP